MKELWKVLMNPYREEGFSKKEMVVYGVVVPVVLIVLMGIAGWMDTMSGL